MAKNKEKLSIDVKILDMKEAKQIINEATGKIKELKGRVEYYKSCTEKLANLIKKGKSICNNMGIDLDEL